MKTINQFRGQYYWLSNFYTAPIEVDGIHYLNNEAAFQAAKCNNFKDRVFFSDLAANEAKWLGRRIQLREDWEQIKDEEMYKAVLAKFTQNPDLMEKLLQTENTELIEGNTWNDRYWGVDLKTGKGENRLGKILMRVRKELQEDNV